MQRQDGHSGVGAGASPARDDTALQRRQLLIELSVLRRRYARLSSEAAEYDDDVSGGVAPPPRRRSSGADASASDASDGARSNDDSGQLCQSDRDAIEALFHSVDDFTRDFNDGKGDLERDDIVSKIMRGTM